MSASVGVLEQETLQPKVLIIAEICTNQLGEHGGSMKIITQLYGNAV
jgi:hypothetical protein